MKSENLTCLSYFNILMDYLLMCIGNRDGGDDAIGPYIADKLKNYINIKTLDCGIVPENYTSMIKNLNPENLIIIDAFEMSLKPGEIRIVPYDKIGVMHVSTHGIPISVLVKYLKQYLSKITIIGIQPKKLSGKITDEVKRSADLLVNLIKNKNLSKIESL